MTKYSHFMRKVSGLCNAEKLLMCRARFMCTHNTAGIDVNTQVALRRKSKMCRIDCPMYVLNNDLNITPHSISENAALEETLFTSFMASPLWGVPQFKR